MNRTLPVLTFVAGLAVLLWVAAGYGLASPLALAVSLMILGFYLFGARELQRFQADTLALDAALAALPEALPQDGSAEGLRGPWLDGLPASLRQAVRARVDGQRAVLPGPALAPYLAGLLVLLGMLGTFLGMVLTLRGTGAALESATDLQAVRASLVGPVKGLGLAFGTSVAGVAGSASLGLMAAWCRRARQQSGLRLDARVGGALRPWTAAWREAQALAQRQQQRDAGLALQQRQTELMPALVERLQAGMDALTRNAQQAEDRLLARQEAFQRSAEAAYQGLATAVAATLQSSVRESAAASAGVIRPLVEETMAGIAREASALHERLGQRTDEALSALSGRLDDNAARVAAQWDAALTRQQQAGEQQAQALLQGLTAFSRHFDERAQALVDTVARDHAARQAEAQALLGRQQAEAQQREAALDAGLARFAQRFEQQSEALVARLGEAQALSQAELQASTAALLRETSALQTQAGQALAGLHQRVSDAVAAQLDQQRRDSEQRAAEMRGALAQFAEQFNERAMHLVEQLAGEHVQRQTEMAAATGSLARELAALQAGASETVARLQAQVSEALERQLAQQQRDSEQRAAELVRSVDGLTAAFDARALALHQQMATQQQQLGEGLATRLDAVAQRLDEGAGRLHEGWHAALTEHQQTSRALHEGTRQALEAASGSFGAQASGLLRELGDNFAALQARVGEAHGATQAEVRSANAALQAELGAAQAALLAEVSRSQAALQERFSTSQAALQAGFTEAQAGMQARFSDTQAAMLGRFTEAHEALHGRLVQAQSTLHADVTGRMAELHASVRDAHAALQSGAAAQDAQRLATWSQGLATLAETLRREWQQAGAQSLAQQQQISSTLEQTARRMSEQAAAQAEATVAEVARLMQAAAAAPQAAAEVIAALRQQISDSLVQDRAVLQERTQLMTTLATLLETVQGAAHEQRSAIDALVQQSGELLARVGEGFSARVDEQAGRLAGLAEQLDGSALEVASLGEAFGGAVATFGESNQALLAQLQRIEEALGRSMTRSDEQLAYYVAQAREVVDLSILSQKQILEDLQRVARGGPAAAAAVSGA